MQKVLNIFMQVLVKVIKIAQFKTIDLFVFSRHAIVSNKSSDFSALHVPRLHEVQLCTVYMNRDKNLPSAGHYFHLLGCSQPYHTYFPFHDQVIPEITELI